MASIEVPHYWTDDRGASFGPVCGRPSRRSPPMTLRQVADWAVSYPNGGAPYSGSGSP